LWNETQTGISVQRGTFNTLLGSVTPLTAIFNQPLWLEVTVVSGPGVSSPLVLSPRNEFASAPYSLGPWLSNSDTLYVTNKSVGIGTASPKSIFHAMDSNSPTHARFGFYKPVSLISNLPQIGFNIYYYYGFKYSDNYSGGTIAFGQHITDGFSFNTAPTGINGNAATLSTRMVITNDGNVGIGTLSPVSPLHIYSRSYDDTAHLTLTENSTGYARLMFQNTAAPTRNWLIRGQLNSDNQYSLLEFRYNNSTTASNILSLSGLGMIGINTDVIPYTLSLKSASPTTDLGIYNSGSGTSTTDGLRIGNYSTGDAWIWNYENGPLYIGTNNATRLWIAADGKVGIGTQTPSALLEVNGDVKVNGNITYSAAKTGYITGTAWATGKGLYSTNSFTYSGGIYNNGTSTGFFEIPVQLPNGVTIASLDIYGYDADATNQLSISFGRQTMGSGSATLVASGGSGAAYASGIVTVTIPVTSNNVVDNSQYSYYIEIALPALTTVKIYSYRITYTYTTPGAIATPIINTNEVINNNNIPQDFPTSGGSVIH
jgi:hypothetical protein